MGKEKRTLARTANKLPRKQDPQKLQDLFSEIDCLLGRKGRAAQRRQDTDSATFAKRMTEKVDRCP
jgi:hypothetical protein